MPFLLVQEPERSQKSFPLQQNSFVIGRTPECDIRINDTKSSRQHVKIYYQHPHYLAEDLKSSNGTLFNNAPLKEPQILKFGDELKIGLTSIRFVAEDEQQDTSPFQLTIYLGEPQEETKTFQLESLILGRLASNEICLQGKGISGQHAELKRIGNQLQLFDLKSRNGVRLNGKPIEKASLIEGDIFEIGTIKIRVEALALLPKDTSVDKVQTPPKPSVPSAPTKKILPPSSASDVEELQEIQLEESPKNELETLTHQLSVLKEERSLSTKKSSRWLVAFFFLSLSLMMPILGVYWIFNALKSEQIQVPLLSIPGNLILGNYSFEYALSSEENAPSTKLIDWQISRGTSAKLSSLSFEGAYALEFAEENLPQTLHFALYQENFPANKTYELQGMIQGEASSGLVGLIIHYQTKNKHHPIVEFSTLLEPSKNYQLVRMPLIPPIQAESFRVGFMAYGKTKAIRFDQLVLTENPSLTPEKPLFEEKGFRLVQNKQGVLQFFYQEQPFFENITLTLQLEGRTLEQTYGTLFPKKNSPKEFEGQIFDPVKNIWISYVLRIVTEPSLGFSVEFPLKNSGTVGLTFEVDPFLFDDTLLILKEAEAYLFLRDKIEEEATGLVFSSNQRIGLQLLSSTISWTYTKNKARFTLERPKENASPLLFQIDPLHKISKQDLKERFVQAKKLESQNQIGGAIQVYQAINNEFPLTPEGKQAKSELARLEQKANHLLQALESQVARALFFKQIHYLEEALQLCQNLAQSYQGTRFSKFSEQVQQELQKALQETLAQEAQEEGRVLLKRAEDFVEAGYPSLAKAFYETILQKWPGTLESQQAQTYLRSLGEKKE